MHDFIFDELYGDDSFGGGGGRKRKNRSRKRGSRGSNLRTMVPTGQTYNPHPPSASIAPTPSEPSGPSAGSSFAQCVADNAQYNTNQNDKTPTVTTGIGCALGLYD